jgi:hypothetical protein
VTPADPGAVPRSHTFRVCGDRTNSGAASGPTTHFPTFALSVCALPTDLTAGERYRKGALQTAQGAPTDVQDGGHGSHRPACPRENTANGERSTGRLFQNGGECYFQHELVSGSRSGLKQVLGPPTRPNPASIERRNPHRESAAVPLPGGVTVLVPLARLFHDFPGSDGLKDAKVASP